MRQTALLAILITTLSASGVAQVQPTPGEGDPHLQTIEYRAGQVFQLRGAPGYQLMVELSPDEQIQSVALGDSAAWQVNINKAADRLFLKPTQGGSATNMTVVTSVRLYAFELTSGFDASSDIPYTVQFRYPPPSEAARNDDFVDVSAAARRQTKYKIGGSRLLRPAAVYDDGKRTYISWPKEAPIPAIYTVDRAGNEVLVNGIMGSDDIYVVDGTPLALTFKIDRESAFARRVNAKRGR